MREIKFRAWDTKNKKMLSFPEIGELMFGYGNNYDHIQAKEAEIMQYTGLKDKNDKEIYEGDIVSDGVDTKSIQWTHNWGRFGFYYANGNEEPLTMNDVQYLEVIGNIYENSKLLKA